MQEKFKKLPLRSGVGIVVLNKENKVFLAKRIDNPKNFWQMPQGGVDEGENYFNAALRELEEETGIKKVKLIREIEEESDAFVINTETDNQLNFAVKLLNG